MAITLEDKVDHALRSMLHDALSGRPASNPAILDDDVNDAIGSMMHDAFSGRAASKVFSSMLGGGGGGGGGSEGAEGLRAQEPTISEVGTKAVTDDDSMRVSYDDFVRAASETHVDWGQVRYRITIHRADDTIHSCQMIHIRCIPKLCHTKYCPKTTSSKPHPISETSIDSEGYAKTE